MSFTFSPLGATYLALLFIPNLAWARLRGREQNPNPLKDNRSLLALERIGQVTVTFAALFAPEREVPGNTGVLCLAASLVAMAAYELSWLRYFRADRSEQTEASLYRKLGPIPLPLAILPVLGFLLLALYEAHLSLLVAVVVLGIGHIGIHRQHERRLR